MKKLTYLFYTFLFLSVSIIPIGCSSATPEEYKRRVETWMNGDVNNLLSAWGIPSNEYTLPNGNKLYTWLSVGGTFVTVNYDNYLGMINSRQVTYWCKTTFTVNGQGKIIFISWEGNNCVSKEE